MIHNKITVHETWVLNKDRYCSLRNTIFITLFILLHLLLEWAFCVTHRHNSDPSTVPWRRQTPFEGLSQPDVQRLHRECGMDSWLCSSLDISFHNYKQDHFTAQKRGGWLILSRDNAFGSRCHSQWLSLRCSNEILGILAEDSILALQTALSKTSSLGQDWFVFAFCVLGDTCGYFCSTIGWYM